MVKVLIFKDNYEGHVLEDVILRKGKGYVYRNYIDGELMSESKIYKIKSDRPYFRAFGKYFYLSDDMLAAFRELVASA